MFNAGEYVFRQGSKGDKFYILITGTLVGLLEPPNLLTNNIKILEQSKQIFKLISGDHFGELALRNNASRSCSVQAVEMSMCAVLKKEDFVKVTGEHTLNQEFQKIEQFLMTTPNFRVCDPDDIKLLSTKLSPVMEESGKVLVNQNERSVRVYILKSGRLSVKRLIEVSSVDTRSYPSMLKPYLSKLPKIVEIEFLVKSQPGDMCLFFEIMHDELSRFKVEVQIPSKMYHCSASDMFDIFSKRDISALPFNDEAMTTDGILLRSHLDQKVWREYAVSCRRTTMNRQATDKFESHRERMTNMVNIKRELDGKLELKSERMNKYLSIAMPLADNSQSQRLTIEEDSRSKRVHRKRILHPESVITIADASLAKSISIKASGCSEVIANQANVSKRHLETDQYYLPMMNRSTSRILTRQASKNNTIHISSVENSRIILRHGPRPTQSTQKPQAQSATRIKQMDPYVDRLLATRCTDIIYAAKVSHNDAYDSRNAISPADIEQQAMAIDKLCSDRLAIKISGRLTMMPATVPEDLSEYIERKIKRVALNLYTKAMKKDDKNKFAGYVEDWNTKQSLKANERKTGKSSRG